MTKANLKKPFFTAVISSLLFAGAIVAVPLIASAQSGSNNGNDVVDVDDVVYDDNDEDDHWY